MTKHEMDSTQTSSEMWYALLMPGYVCAAIEEQHVMHRQEKERMATMSLLLALPAERAIRSGDRERGAHRERVVRAHPAPSQRAWPTSEAAVSERK